MTSIPAFNRWLQDKENASLECKEAKHGYDEGELMEYCAAIANGNGGKFILGVDTSHTVVGTTAFAGTLGKIQHELLQQLNLRVEVEELRHSQGRVLVFHVPRHRAGSPVQYKGRYYTRIGPVKMESEEIRRIVNETEEDFSARIVPNLALTDLDARAIEILKERRAKKAGRSELISADTESTLRDLQLLTDDGLTYAALILLGKPEKIAQMLNQSEIIYEWRGESTKITYDFRKEWKAAYLVVVDDIWKIVDDRNIRTPHQQGFDVPLVIASFEETSCREALNNAVTHRDYRIASQSVFVRCSPQAFAITSPGGFPEGVTQENALDRSKWRNKLIAETLQHIGLVERSGQGLNRIFEESIRHGKGSPDFTESDDHEVHLNIPAQLKDANFVHYLEKIANERQIVFSLQELIELDQIREKGKASHLQNREKFLELGLIEQHGKTRGAQYILARQFYDSIDRRGIHTREKGLSRDAKKQLILQHLQENKRVQLWELQDAFPGVPARTLSNVLQELKDNNIIERVGSRKTGYWVLRKLDLNISSADKRAQKSAFNKPK
ncbi:putative DNA binding domain-containing protein [Candidatus Peregrinibacteria bacterium]|nr:putative DNA binding domain-containing protein [Candidatus Peregrinibacteria bacterium]